MPLDKAFLENACRAVMDPATGGDIVSLGALRKSAACDGHASLTVAVHPDLPADGRDALVKAIRIACYRAAAQSGESIAQCNTELVEDAQNSVKGSVKGSATASGEAPAAEPKPAAREPHSEHPQAEAPGIPGVARVVAVGAGKGGVGKSTVAVNLAVGLARQGRKVGLLDGDIYGPSLPTMLGMHAMTPDVSGDRMQPFEVAGLKAVTIGKLVEPEKPLIWRGPMAHGAFNQLANQTDWGELDDLIIDLPPGTGDVMLTMSQNIALDGAVVVCTPQRVAQDDAVRAARMFQTLKIPVLGVVENMSYFVGDDGKEYDLFGRGGAERMAQRLGLPFLGGVPITTALRENGDAGTPHENFEQGGDLASALESVVDQFLRQADLAAMRKARATPSLTIS